MAEETEPESSFKDTDKKQRDNKGFPKNQSSVPKTVHEVEAEYEMADREDDFSDESEDEGVKQEKNLLKDFTFIPGSKKDDNMSHSFMAQTHSIDIDNLSSAERINSYLNSELGSTLFDKIHPVIKAFGDEILLADKMNELKHKLKPYLSESQVDKYHQYFATLVFFELEDEKNANNQ